MSVILGQETDKKIGGGDLASPEVAQPNRLVRPPRY